MSRQAVIPSSMWTLVLGTKLLVYHHAGHNMTVTVEEDGTISFPPTNAALWKVKAEPKPDWVHPRP